MLVCGSKRTYQLYVCKYNRVKKTVNISDRKRNRNWKEVKTKLILWKINGYNFFIHVQSNEMKKSLKVWVFILSDYVQPPNYHSLTHYRTGLYIHHILRNDSQTHPLSQTACSFLFSLKPLFKTWNPPTYSRSRL